MIELISNQNERKIACVDCRRETIVCSAFRHARASWYTPAFNIGPEADKITGTVSINVAVTLTKIVTTKTVSDVHKCRSCC